MEYQQRRSVESLEGLLEEGNADEYLPFVNLFEAQVQADIERASQMSELLKDAIATVLTPRQQEVVRLRYGFDEGPCMEPEEYIGYRSEGYTIVNQHGHEVITLHGMIPWNCSSVMHGNGYVSRVVAMRAGTM